MIEFRAIVSFDDSHDTWTSSPSITGWDMNKQKAMNHIEAHAELPGFKGAKIERREVGVPEVEEHFLPDYLK